MRKSLRVVLIIVSVLFCYCFGFSQHFDPTVIDASFHGFERNNGQVQYLDPTYSHDVQYTLKDKDLTLFFHKSGITYQWRSVEFMEEGAIDAVVPKGKKDGTLRVKSVSTFRLDQVWEGASEYTTIVAENPLTGYLNYSRQETDISVQEYSKIIYRNIYPNIDIEYYVKDNHLKYDIIVKSGGDISLVKFHYKNVNPTLVNGKVRIETPLGFLEENQPLTYTNAGQKLESRYARNGQQFWFDVAGSGTIQSFTVDPDLIWGSYYGGTAFDRTDDIVVDATGNVYMSGATGSNNAIAISGHQTTFGGGTRDAYLVKFNSAGVRQWATYYGGTSDDFGTSVAVDASGNLYASGYTGSATGISTTGAHQTTPGGGTDAFLVKFNSSGTRLWATYYGGSADEISYSVAVDASGNAYISGYTSSTTGIATGGHQNTLSGGNDAFLVKFNSSGVRQWSTYYGGTGEEYGMSCAVDASGNVYIGGQTFSSSGISTTGSHQATFGGGTVRDGFLVKFNTSGSRQWATYYGGASEDYFYTVTTDPTGNVIISGATNSTTAIASSGSHQVSLSGTSYDVFVAKFNTSGVRQWGTYYGGSEFDDAGVFQSLYTDINSNVYLVGSTNSTDGIASGGFMTTLAGGYDGFLVKFNLSGVRQWSTYYGGVLDDYARAVATDPSSDFVYIGGTTYSVSGIASGGHQSALGGDGDGFLVKFRGTALPGAPTITSFAPASASAGASVTITGTNFSATTSNNTVYFGATKAIVTNASTTTLTVTVPFGATLKPITVTVGGLTAYSRQSFIPIFSGSSGIDATTLATKVDFGTGTGTIYATLADVDGDGKTDILAANSTTTSFSALRNTATAGAISAASFAAKVDFTTASAPLCIEYGDVDGDGKLDMVVVNSSSNSISVYRNTSTSGAITTGSFAAKVDFSTSLSTPRNAEIRDFNGDGKPDIAITNGGSTVVSVFPNTTTTGVINSGSLGVPLTFTVGSGSRAIISNDVDGDGKADLILANVTSNTISVLRNTSTSTISFATKVDFATGTAPNGIGIADLDGDGKEDIVEVNGTSNTISVFRNTSTSGAITLAARVDFTVGTGPVGTAIGDINGDGKPDLISSNGGNNTISILRNTATSGSITSGSFAAKVDFAGSTPSYGIAIGDIDGDGKPEVVVPNSGSGVNTVSVFRNTASSSTPEPTAQPTAFVVGSLGSTSYTVSFTAATGSPTGYIAIRKAGSAPTLDPIDGTSYTLGSPHGDGTIAHVGSAVSFNEVGMTPATQYFYKIYSYNGTGSAINYRIASPLPGNVTTEASPAGNPNLAFKNVSNSYLTNLYAIRFASNLTAIAVGSSGLAIRTTDGGTIWSTLTIPSSVTLWNVTFSNATTGYIVGDGGLILKSINTGTTWSTLTSGTTNDLYAISFPSLNTGYACGASGTLLKTTNGGTTWTPLVSGVTSTYLNSVVFTTDLIGMASGPAGVIRTTDGGATWTSVSTQPILWLSFPSASIGYGVGEVGSIIKTTNGGASWSTLSSITSEFLWGAHFTSDLVGFAVGENATIIKTSNGGTNWTNTTTDISSITLNAVHFGTVDFGIAVGETGTILKTEGELPAIAITSVNAKNEIPAKGGTTVSITIPTADVPRVDEVTVYVYDIQDVANDIYTNGVPLPTTVSGGTFTATFNDLQSDPIGYYYFFEIAYEGYLRYTYSDPYYAYLKYENTNTLKLPALKSGSSANDYQIISVPLQLTNAQISSVFDELMPADKSKWRMFTYQSGTTVEQAVSGQVTPGKGYWLISTSSPTIDLGTGKTVAANGESPFTMNLSSGWNLIGNPYNFNVTWNAGTAVRELKQFNNGSYSTASSMSPFVGYYVFANTAGSYPIPVTGTFSGGRKRTSRFDQSEIAWELPITLQRGDLKNELGGIGIHAEASEGFDELDEPALPIPVSQNMFAMLFDRTDLPYSLNKEVVPVTESHRWNFTINQPEGTESVEMKWDPALLTHLSKRLYLYDEAKLELVDMMTRSNHFTQANASLSILYGDENFIRQSTLGKDSRVAQPYPNPAREQLSIPVMMAETGTVTVTIKDSFGRSVQSFSNQVERGHHQLTLTDMRDIPAGMYFVSTEILTGTTRYIKTHKILINQTSR